MAPYVTPDIYGPVNPLLQSWNIIRSTHRAALHLIQASHITRNLFKDFYEADAFKLKCENYFVGRNN